MDYPDCGHFAWKPRRRAKTRGSRVVFSSPLGGLQSCPAAEKATRPRNRCLRRGELAACAARSLHGPDKIADIPPTDACCRPRSSAGRAALEAFDAGPSRSGNYWATPTDPAATRPRRKAPPLRGFSMVGAPRFELGTSSPPDFSSARAGCVGEWRELDISPANRPEARSLPRILPRASFLTFGRGLGARGKLESGRPAQSEGGPDGRVPVQARDDGRRTCEPVDVRDRRLQLREGDEIPLGRRTLRVVGIRDDDADQPPVLVVEDMTE
jgi:hypothetical protein